MVIWSYTDLNVWRKFLIQHFLSSDYLNIAIHIRISKRLAEYNVRSPPIKISIICWTIWSPIPNVICWDGFTCFSITKFIQRINYWFDILNRSKWVNSELKLALIKAFSHGLCKNVNAAMMFSLKVSQSEQRRYKDVVKTSSF